MTLHLPNEMITFANNFFASNGITANEPIIALNPATTWPSKNWSAEYYATLAKALQSHGRLLLCGGPADQRLAERIMHQSGVPVINAVGQTNLLQLAALLSRSSVLVTGDTGPLHMAIALDVPTVSLFGPTDPRKFGPLTPGHIVLQEQFNCQPCHKKRCPLSHLNCLQSLSPDRVITAVRTLLTK
jgi:3-deoxy-D-manno-octulosonic-acid transferase